MQICKSKHICVILLVNTKTQEKLSVSIIYMLLMQYFTALALEHCEC